MVDLEQIKGVLSNLSSLDPKSLLVGLVDVVKEASLSVQIGLALLTIFGLTNGRSWYKQIVVRLIYAARRRKAWSGRESALQALRETLPTDKATCEKHKTITKLSAEELSKQLRNGQVKPLEALQAYQQQALESHQQTNCLVCPITEAAEWAEQLDSGDKGMLYGLPIALKDDHNIKGYDSVIGCSKFIGKPEKEDSVIVQVLKKQGAIPFVKTNVPQTMISLESSNPVFGTTVNVHDHTRSAGGSSGGTAALVASGGAILGTGSDLGGSIRCPAAFNGICGFKPTGGRMSGKGIQGPVKGASLVPVSYGPLSRDVAGCVLYMKAMWSGYMWKLDPTVPPVEFLDTIYEDKKQLRIGYFLDNGIIPAVPACERAVKIAGDALKKAGHTVVPITLPNCEGLPSYVTYSALGDQGTGLLDTLRYDAIDFKAIGLLFVSLITPIWLKKVVALLIWPVNRHLSTEVRDSCRFSTVNKWWQMTDQMEKDCDVFYRYWKEQGFDAIICPSFATHTIALGHSDVLIAGVVPVTKVSKEDEQKASQEYPATTRIQKIIKENAEKNAAGLPVCVQCATLPWQDELCLRVMKDIEHNVPSL